jgi:hypothetical protein
MKRHNKKGAIELSANFIIVIIISLVIVVGGLSMFFNMKKNAQKLVDTLDDQTQERIKNMMLSGTERVAVYPSDPTLVSGDAKLIGVGITNIYDGPGQADFDIQIVGVDFYPKNNPNAATPMNPANYADSVQSSITIQPHSQAVKGILLRMPGSSLKGQYVYTIDITVDDRSGTGFQPYGVLQVYASNP